MQENVETKFLIFEALVERNLRLKRGRHSEEILLHFCSIKMIFLIKLSSVSYFLTQLHGVTGKYELASII